MSYGYTAPVLNSVTYYSPTNMGLQWTDSVSASTAVALFHFEGTNGSATYTDTAGNNTMTGGGQFGTYPVLSNTQYKFGSESLYLFAADVQNIAGPTLSGGEPIDLSQYTSWTVEGWFYSLGSTGVIQMIFNLTDSLMQTGVLVELTTSATISCSVGVGGSNFTLAAPANTTTISYNAWHHFALVWDGTHGMCYVFVDGTLTGPSSSQSFSSYFSSNFSGMQLQIGGVRKSLPIGAIDGFNGYLDDIRVTPYALYTSNFTPSSSTLPLVQPNGGPPPAYYEINRNGTNIATVSGTATTYTDTGPFLPATTYNYELAAWSGSAYLSAQSNIVGVTTPGTPIQVGGYFVSAPAVGPAVQLSNVAGIKPRIYAPVQNLTVRSRS